MKKNSYFSRNEIVMNIQTKKYNLIYQIMQINDELLIDTVKNLLDFGLQYQSNEEVNEVSDFWDELTDTQKSRIELSIKQMEAGEGIPHEEVMAEFRQKYKRQ